MAKPYLDEKEISTFKERMEATQTLGAKYGITFVPHQNTVFNSLEILKAISTERLGNSSRRLECLTWVLVGLTIILTILTGMTVWKAFFP